MDPVDRARSLRRDATPPEKKLWNHLRDRRLGGLKFRRQEPVAGFVLDFYCHEARLGIELDGQRHDRVRDAERDAAILTEGVGVLRFTVSAFEKDTDAVLRTIQRACRERMDART